MELSGVSAADSEGDISFITWRLYITVYYVHDK